LEVAFVINKVNFAMVSFWAKHFGMVDAKTG